MATYTIASGQHGDGSIVCPWLFKLPNLVRYVKFDASCAYTLEAYQQQDVNKLYGLSFGFSEDNSARFGWRWQPATQRIELIPYCHLNGVLNRNDQFDFPVVATVQIGDVVRCEIKVSSNIYVFTCQVNGVNLPAVSVSHGKINTTYGVTRGFWFGGDSVAPHEMKVEMDTKSFT